MPVVIPLRSDLPHYSLQVQLDGRLYGLELLWREREGGWCLSLLDADGAPILSGVRVVVGWPLAYRTTDPRGLPGRLIAASDSGDAPPGIDDLGARVSLLYFDAAELAEIAG